jgi:hypothetical protein
MPGWYQLQVFDRGETLFLIAAELTEPAFSEAEIKQAIFDVSADEILARMGVATDLSMGSLIRLERPPQYRGRFARRCSTKPSVKVWGATLA